MFQHYSLSVKMIFQLVVGLVLIRASHQARSTSEIQSWFLEKAMECSKQQPIPAEEMVLMKTHKLPDSDGAKCLMACVMRKANYLNDEGNFDAEQANEWAKKEFHDDQKRLESSEKLYDLCKKVNDDPVTDGTKGCQRAYNLCKCLMENAPKMGFALQ